MKLRVEKGGRAGEIFDLEAALVTIGRADDNDVVLSDEMVSQHHAKIWRDLDGHVSLTDMGSVNGTEVNGRLVQTVELRMGDRIVFGKSIMRIVDEAAAETLPPKSSKPVPQPEKEKSAKKELPKVPPSTDSIDLGLGGRGRRESNRERAGQGEGSKPAVATFMTKRLMIVFIVAALAVLVALIMRPPEILRNLFSSKTVRKAQAPSGGQNSKMTELDVELYLEDIVVDLPVGRGLRNVNRREITLKKGKVSVQYDDLVDNIRRREQKELSETQLKEFINSLNLDALLDVPSEKLSALRSDSYSQVDFRMTFGSDFHRIVVRNDLAPPALARTRAAFDSFIQAAWGATFFLPKTQRLEKAGEAFENAERYRAAINVNVANRYNAIKFYREALEYLKGLETEPLYEAANKGKVEEENVMNEEAGGLFSKAQLRENVKDWDGAEKLLNMLLQMVPAKEEEWNLRARNELINVRRRKEL